MTMNLPLLLPKKVDTNHVPFIVVMNVVEEMLTKQYTSS
jgi:hypothetical protein